MKRLTVQITDDNFKNVKVLAAQKSMTLRKLIESAIELISKGGAK